MRAEIVPAVEVHIAPIAEKARPADIAELWAIARATPAQCLRQGLRQSANAYTGMIDDEPVCMFGATPYSILSGIGVPWMVGTIALDSLRAQKQLLRHARPVLEAMRRQFPAQLVNVVDDRNEAAKRWIAWLGFTLLDPQPLGRDRVLFRPFYLESPHV